MDREDQKDLLDSVAAEGRETRDKLFPKGDVLADIFSFALNTGRAIDDVLAQKYPHFLEFSRGNRRGAKALRGQEAHRERGRFRRPAGKTAHHAAQPSGHRGALPAAVSVCARRRIPGHESPPGGADRHPRQTAPQRDGGGRRRAVHLLVARREFSKTSSNSPSATRTRPSTRSRRTTARSRRSSMWPMRPSRRTCSSFARNW